MPVTTFIGTEAVDSTLKPKATTGSWGWGPVTIEYTFTFTSQFFDGDLKILGIKVATVTLDADGSETIDIGALGWDISGKLTMSSADPDKHVVADLQISDNGVVKFNHEFVLFTWR